jgi:hypothetical protein
MSKTCIPFSVDDISALARSLREQLTNCDHIPGHVELLNMLARSTGHRNFQSLRAHAAARHLLHAQQASPEPIDHNLVKQAGRCFDVQGRLMSWPAKSMLKELCLWVLWSKLPPRLSLMESELNMAIRANHLFGDHALLRRELCDRALLTRTPDGREYRRVERRPSPEAIAVIRQLAGRQ